MQIITLTNLIMVGLQRLLESFLTQRIIQSPASTTSLGTRSAGLVPFPWQLHSCALYRCPVSPVAGKLPFLHHHITLSLCNMPGLIDDSLFPVRRWRLQHKCGEWILFQFLTVRWTRKVTASSDHHATHERKTTGDLMHLSSTAWNGSAGYRASGTQPPLAPRHGPVQAPSVHCCAQWDSNETAMANLHFAKFSTIPCYISLIWQCHLLWRIVDHNL